MLSFASQNKDGFDKPQAIAQGRNVANYVFDHTFLPPVSKK